MIPHLEAHTNGSINIRALISSAQWSSSIMSGPKDLTLDLNIYGQRNDAQQVGKLLTNIGISLQQPLYGLESFIYYNPHFLHIDEMRGEDVRETPLLSIQPAESNISPSLHHTANVMTATIDAEEEVAMIFDSLNNNQILKKRDTDKSRMKIELRE